MRFFNPRAQGGQYSWSLSVAAGTSPFPSSASLLFVSVHCLNRLLLPPYWSPTIVGAIDRYYSSTPVNKRYAMRFSGLPLLLLVLRGRQRMGVSRCWLLPVLAKCRTRSVLRAEVICPTSACGEQSSDRRLLKACRLTAQSETVTRLPLAIAKRALLAKSSTNASRVATTSISRTDPSEWANKNVNKKRCRSTSGGSGSWGYTSSYRLSITRKRPAEISFVRCECGKGRERLYFIDSLWHAATSDLNESQSTRPM